jgi:ABC-type multidrug transport system fused ATPase/permease subunit
MAVIIIIGSNLYQAGKINLGDITSFLLYMMQILMNFMILAAVVGSIA